MDEEQTADRWHELALGSTPLDFDGMAHGDEHLQALCFELVAYGKFATVGDAHGIPSHRVVGALYGGDGGERLHAGHLCFV